MTIRRYSETDWPAIVDIYDLSKNYEFMGIGSELEIVPLAQDDAMLKTFRESTIYVFDDGSIKGFIGIKGLLISYLFVHPNYRRLRIASKLIEHILETTKGNLTYTWHLKIPTLNSFIGNTGFLWGRDLKENIMIRPWMF